MGAGHPRYLVLQLYPVSENPSAMETVYGITVEYQMGGFLDFLGSLGLELYFPGHQEVQAPQTRAGLGGGSLLSL